MNIQKLNLYSFFIENKKNLYFFSKMHALPFMTNQCREMFRAFLKVEKGVSEVRLMSLSESTAKRISCIPTDKINGKSLTQLKSKPRNGIVMIDDKLHFSYSITNSGIHIAVSRGLYKKVLPKEQLIHQMTNLLSGYIYIDFMSDDMEYWISSILDLKRKPDNLLFKDRSFITEQGKLLKSSKEVINRLSDSYTNKHAETRLCLQAFLFIHLAKVYDVTKISQEDNSVSFSERIKNKAKSNIEVIRIDTNYDRNVTVINPFSVTGHFRNQPCGAERKETKLIYIDQFMKTGYTREATKTKIGLDTPEQIEN